MSNQALSFIGRLDRREESFVMNQLQEQAFVKRLLGNRDGRAETGPGRVRAPADGGRVGAGDVEKLSLPII